MEARRHGRAIQLLGSIVAAAIIVAVTILIVSARIGPAGVDSEAREERLEELQERNDIDAENGRGRNRGRSGRDQ